MIIRVNQFSPKSLAIEATFTLFGQAKDSIRAIKELIQKHQNIPLGEQYISQKKMQFFDENLPLADYHLHLESDGEILLDLTVFKTPLVSGKDFLTVPIIAPEMPIPITLFYKNIPHSFTFQGKTAVHSVKQKVLAKLGIELKIQRLLFQGTELADEKKSLAQCFVAPNSTLTLVERVRSSPSSILQLIMKKFITLEPNISLYMNLNQEEDQKRTHFSTGIRWPTLRPIVVHFDIAKFVHANWEQEGLNAKCSLYLQDNLVISFKCLEKSEEEWICKCDLKNQLVSTSGIESGECFKVEKSPLQMQISFLPPWGSLRHGCTYQISLRSESESVESSGLSFLFNVSDNNNSATLIDGEQPQSKKTRGLFSGRKSITTLESFLASAGLEHHLNLFKNHEIDLDTLFLLNEEQLKELQLPLGARVKLAHTLASYK